MISNVFNNPDFNVGGCVGSGGYMQAPGSLVKALHDMKTELAVKSAHSQAMDMLHVYRTGNYGVR